MAALPTLSAQQPIVGPDGRPTTAFLLFMEKTRTAQAETDAGQQELLDALAEAVAAIQAAQAAAAAAQEAAEQATQAATEAQDAVAVANLAIANLDDRVSALEAPE